MADWDPRSEYARRLSARAATTASRERTHLLVSNLRLATVAVAALLLYLVIAARSLAPIWLLAPALVFAALMIWHARVLNALDRAKRAEAYYHRGVSRMDGTWVGAGPDGGRFLTGHAYAADLDLFGAGSLFQLLTTARTEAGEETLGRWLAGPASASDVSARQGAVQELRERIDFREDLAVLAAEAHVSRTGTLARWSQKPPAGLTTVHAWIFAVCAVITTGIVVAVAAVDGVTTLHLVIWLTLQSLIAAIWRVRVGQVLRGVDAAANDLSLLTELLQRIESETFRSLQLKALHRALVADGVPPSRRIAQLQLLLAVRDAPRNEIVRPFALMLMVRSQVAVAIDRWHAAHRGDLALWLEAVGELEALSSLATYSYEHPDDVFPAISSGDAEFTAAGLAHPLIPERSAVRNDVRLGGAAPHVLMVSGSNMSGKSTLLRAVGVNTTLALAGAPVRAHALTLSPLVIGATIRVQDSLQQGQSHFYAEILRLRDIVERATVKKDTVLFLLDEILHGTNSYDRRIGADAIVQALVDAGAIGLVTTHDLALTALTEVLGPRARNVHFEDRVEAGAISFDYRMRDGIVERSNALELMRSVGLKV